MSRRKTKVLLLARRIIHSGARHIDKALEHNNKNDHTDKDEIMIEVHSKVVRTVTSKSTPTKPKALKSILKKVKRRLSGMAGKRSFFGHHTVESSAPKCPGRRGSMSDDDNDADDGLEPEGHGGGGGERLRVGWGLEASALRYGQALSGA